jgi:aminopeptidase C
MTVTLESPLAAADHCYLLPQNPTLNLSRLVITHNDPVATLIDRSALVKDHKVFNLSLKGIGEAGSYPGPRVSQNSSGRCWLFATSELYESPWNRLLTAI